MKRNYGLAITADASRPYVLSLKFIKDGLLMNLIFMTSNKLNRYLKRGLVIF